MTGLALRLLRERRAVILPLAVALLANAAIIGFVVLPVVGPRGARRGSGSRSPLQELVAAQRESRAAARTQRDKVEAEADLKKFYAEVLPADMAGARRATYVHLAQLAKDADLQYQRRQEEPREPRQGDERPGARADALRHHDGAEGRLRERAAVHPRRRGVDGFIVIDNVGLSGGRRARGSRWC